MLGEKAEVSYFCFCKLLFDKEADILRIKKSLFQLFLFFLFVSVISKMHTYIINNFKAHI